MNFHRLAVIVLRVLGVDWIVSGIQWLVIIPRVLFNLLDAHPETLYATDLEISLVMHFIHVAWDVGVGVGLIVWSKPCGQFLMKFFSSGAAAVEVSGVWPPAPRKPVTAATQATLEINGAHRLTLVAELLLRIEGMAWLFASVRELIELPEDIFVLAQHPSGRVGAHYVLSASVTVMEILLQLSVGLYLLFLPQSLAYRLTQDLARDAEEDSFETSAVPLAHPVMGETRNLP